MKSQTLPVKRRPVSKGLFRRLNAVTYGRRQRVAAAPSAAEMDMDDGDSKISRALTIIFLIHIVAIALIFIHQKFLAGRSPAFSLMPVAQSHEGSTAAGERKLPDASLSSGEKPYIVKAGDDYTGIAAAEGVSETALRKLNNDKVLKPGLILRLPEAKPATSSAPVMVKVQQPAGDAMRGPAEASPVDVNNAPRAHAVASPGDGTGATGPNYVVKSGDNIFRIASGHKVSQQSLMQANGITDPRKLRAGMKLVIPAN